MKRIPLLLLLAWLALPLAQAKPKKSAAPPAIFGQAKFVYVETPDGDAFTPGLLPEDRQAIFDVEKAIRSWNRYQLTPRRDQAELLFVVRRGRVATADTHVGLSTGNHSPNGRIDPGSTNPQGNTVGGGAEVGPPDDLLFIYILNSEAKLGTPIWNKSEPDGLRSPDVPLLREVKGEVDSAYPMK
jgi:hypothetical protein